MDKIPAEKPGLKYGSDELGDYITKRCGTDVERILFAPPGPPPRPEKKYK